jgi:hypothetical protein
VKLWLIYQDTNDAYDTYDSAVVAAETEEEARKTHPGSDSAYWDETRQSFYYRSTRVADFKLSNWAPHLDNVGVRLLGDALPGTEAGVICASYNAG